jgi:hypothetical protein
MCGVVPFPEIFRRLTVFPRAAVHADTLVDLCRNRVTKIGMEGILKRQLVEEGFLTECLENIGTGVVVKAELISDGDGPLVTLTDFEGTLGIENTTFAEHHTHTHAHTHTHTHTHSLSLSLSLSLSPSLPLSLTMTVWQKSRRT